jgi:RNA polymerase sigma-70 factor (ECF subfamily)
MAKERERILDAYLIASGRIGDRRALGSLVQRWNSKLLAHAWRLLRDREAARDAVQESWTEMLRSLARLRNDQAFAAWAYRIVSRRCARQIGRLQRDRRLAGELPAAVIEEAELGAPELDSDALHRAIRRLPPEQQAAIALFYLEEMSVAEVAVALDVPAGTVKTRLMHARRKLRGALEGDV